MCDKREHVDRSLPNEDTKFQYCTIKHHVASKCFCVRSFHRSSWKHIVSSGWRSSFVLKMNWWLQKCSKCRKKHMVMNVYLFCTNVFKWYRKFCNGRESAEDDQRAGHPRISRTLEHIAKVRTASANDQRSTIRIWAKRFHTDKETICKIYSWLDKLTSYSTGVVQWFHRRLWAPLVVCWRKYTGSYGKNKYFDLNIHVLWKIWRFTKKWGAFLLGIKFPFMRVQMENLIFYHLPLVYW